MYIYYGKVIKRETCETVAHIFNFYIQYTRIILWFFFQVFTKMKSYTLTSPCLHINTEFDRDDHWWKDDDRSWSIIISNFNHQITNN